MKSHYWFNPSPARASTFLCGKREHCSTPGCHCFIFSVTHVHNASFVLSKNEVQIANSSLDLEIAVEAIDQMEADVWFELFEPAVKAIQMGYSANYVIKKYKISDNDSPIHHRIEKELHHVEVCIRSHENLLCHLRRRFLS